MHDLPKHAGPAEFSQFRHDLRTFCARLSPDLWTPACETYDWSSVQAHLVYSYPGYFDAVLSTASGLSMLQLRAKPFVHTPEGYTLEYQGSSLGSNPPAFMNDFYRAATNSKGTRPAIAIVFPSLAYAKSAPGGPEVAPPTCICV